ncbi:MAG: protoporphyrinogen oxidase, partial [Actinomyces sp.]
MSTRGGPGVGPPAGRVVVVGAGITGLTAAHELLRTRPGLELVVLEAASRPGGKIAGGPVGPLVVDAGPDGFLARRPEVADLARELGLGDDLVRPAAARPRVWYRGALHDLPTPSVLGVPLDPDALAATGLVGPEAVARLRAELDADHPPLVGDAAVGEVLRPRLGDEIVDVIVDPLLGGINAGSADELSLDAGAPALAEAVHRGGSLIRRLAETAGEAAARPGPVFLGLRGGMTRLVEALVAELGPRLRTGVSVEGVARRGSAWVVATSTGERLEADAVIVTTPAPVTARLFTPVAPDVARHFAAIEVADVAFVTLVWRRDDVAHPLDGSGFLVARGARASTDAGPDEEPLLTTACSWTSSKWDHVGDTDHVAVRMAVGRTDDRRWLDLDHDTLVARLLAEADATL